MRASVRRAIAALTSSSIAEPAGSPVRPPDSPASRNVLVPLDGSEASYRALRTALASAAPGCSVYALEIVAELQADADHIRQAILPECREERAVAAVQRELRTRGIRGVEVIARTGPRRQAIVRAAADLQCDLIVVPRAPRTCLARLFTRPAAEAMARQAGCPVLVV